MKILILFTDMIRQNRLSVLNKNETQSYDFDEIIKGIGGTYYTNCYTVAPDTPRSLATVFSGLVPIINGCDSHTKWPQFFLQENVTNIFQIFNEKGYQIDFLSDPVERRCGIFPQYAIDNYVHNEQYSVEEFFKGLNIEDKHVIFACFPQFHWTLDAIGASTFGEKKGYQNLSEALKNMQKFINIEDFDHIFMFSDHGFKFSYELRTNPTYSILDEDRTNVLFLHKQKSETQLSTNNSLCTILDLKSMFIQILNADKCSARDYFLRERDHIIIEDHKSFTVGVTDPIERWALKTPSSYYIRDVVSGYLKKSEEDKFSPIVSSELDEILRENHTFNHVTKIQNLRGLYTNMLNNDFIAKNAVYDNRPKRINSISNKFLKFIDIIKKVFGLI